MNRWCGLIRWGLALLMLSSTMSAWAIPVNNQDKVSISPALGYIWFDDKRDLKSNLFPNFALGYYFTPYWKIQLKVGGFDASRRKHGADSGHGYSYSAEGYYYLFPHYRVEPYLTVGLGTFHLTESHGNDAAVLANFSGGAGIEFFLDRYASMFVGVRDFYTPVGGKNDIMVNAGINIFLFHFPVNFSGLTGSQLSQVGGTTDHAADEQGIITVGLSDDEDTKTSTPSPSNDSSGTIFVGADGVSTEGGGASAATGFS